MIALYKIDLRTLEYCIFSNGVGLRFDVTGRYKGEARSVDSSAVPVDVVSILQQGNQCEVAVLSGSNYCKQRVDLNRAISWTKSCPLHARAVLPLKRKVKDVSCLQTIYVYGNNTIAPYLSSLL